MNYRLPNSLENVRTTATVFVAFLICLFLPANYFSQQRSTLPTATQEQANRELDEAAAAYRQGKFAEAQLHSEKAFAIDPENKKAPYFIARTIHAQFKPTDFSQENLAKGREAIAAYQRILVRTPNDEESYKAIAFLYGGLKEDALLRDWVLKRASDPSIETEKRSEAYVVLASKDWDCSFKITELPSNKLTTVTRSKVVVRYHKPADDTEFEQARQCSSRGLEMAGMAITLTPGDVAAWSYKTNLLLELEKIAEMSEDVQQKSDLHRQYEESLKQTTILSSAAREKDEKPEH
jgi:tetratricopeptide (TPR) repeat protein